MSRKNREKRDLSKQEKREETERERVRKKNRKKSKFSGFFAFLMLLLFLGLGYLVYENVRDFFEKKEMVIEKKEEEESSVEIINEKNGEISSRVKEYITQLQGDLSEEGFRLLRAVLPAEKMREIDVDIEGVMPYFRVSVDRGTAVTAEDISRMVKYLRENNLIEGVKYVDVRVEGKAFYK